MALSAMRMGGAGFGAAALLLLVSGSLGVGCATPPAAGTVPAGGASRPAEASKPLVDFPSQGKLLAIAAEPMPAPGVVKHQAHARDWTVDGTHTAASSGAGWQPVSGWDGAVVAALARSGRDCRFTQAMRCAAEEFSRFFLETREFPPEDVKRFIAAACGGVSAEVGMLTLEGEATPKTSDEALLARWKGQISSGLVEPMPAGACEAGFFLGRRGKQAVALLAFGRTYADVLPFSLVPDERGEVTVEGETREAADYFAGFANRGALGVEACLVDPSLHRPRFRFVCHVDAADESAWIDLVSVAPGRAVGKPFARLLARQKPGQPLTFHAVVTTTAGRIEHEADFSPLVLAELNRIRQTAGLPPVRLAEAESRTATQLARPYILSETGGNREEADTIALGLIAGWQVDDAMIRQGSFVVSSVPDSTDAALWLNLVLSMPMARESLLDRAIEEVALGPALMSDPPALAAILTGYRLYHGNDHTQDVQRLFARVMAARKRLGLAPPRRLGDVKQAMLEQLAKVYEGTLEPSEALQAVLKQGTRAYGENMKGYTVELISLDQLEIPEKTLKLPHLDLEIGVTHHRPKGSPWGQMVVLVAFLDRADDAK